MKNLILATAALSAAALSVGAVTDFTEKPRGRDADRQTRLSERATISKASSPFGKVLPQKGMMKVIGTSGDDISLIEQLGTLHLKVEEDFSLLTQGSPEAPDMSVNLEVNSMELFQNAWWTFNSAYTHTPNWGVNSSYPAGGTLYMHGEYDQVHLNTPLIKLNDHSGMAVLEFKVRTFEPGDTFDHLMIEAAETRGMGPTWDILETTTVVNGITNEWGTIRVLYRGAGPTTMFNIATGDYTKLLIDDVKVYELEPDVAMPATLPHSDYSGYSFTANWEPVNGADHYLLSVFEYNADRERLFVMEDAAVDGTSCEVTGVESGEIYYYTVKAVKDGRESIESFERRVYDLEVPLMDPAVETGEFSYTASWTHSPKAEAFNYWAYDLRTAEAAGDFIVTEEDFDGVLGADGEPTGWTMEEPEEYSYDLFYPMEMRQQGWHGTHCAPYTDYIALDSWWYEWVGEDAGFLSPEMDLSKDGGRFTLEADLASLTAEYWDGKQTQYVTTQACVALFNWDEEIGDFRQAELVYLSEEIDEEWTHRTFQLTKGTERSVVGIYAIRGLDWLFIDNLKITQRYAAGESLLEPFRYARFHGTKEGEDPCSIEIEVPAHATGKEIYHKVSAFGRMVDEYAQRYDDRESKYSDLEFVRTTRDISSVKGLSLLEPSAIQKDGMLTIINPGRSMIAVADISGNVIFRTSDPQASFMLPAHGVYVAGGKKIIY